MKILNSSTIGFLKVLKIIKLSLFFLFACGGSPSPGVTGDILLRNSETPSAVMQAQCNVTAKKCTRCHPIDRLLGAQVSSPKGWQQYVNRMRLMPGASISPTNATDILDCLVFRSWGQEGLANFKGGQVE